MWVLEVSGFVGGFNFRAIGLKDSGFSLALGRTFQTDSEAPFLFHGPGEPFRVLDVLNPLGPRSVLTPNPISLYA